MLMERKLSKLVYSKWFRRFSAFFIFKFSAFAFIYYFYYYSSTSAHVPGTDVYSIPRTDVNSIPRTSNSAPDSKVILLWTSFYDKWVFPYGDPKKCPSDKSCEVTFDRSRLKESDAIVFHIRDIDLTDLPKYRHPRQRWVFFNMEPPPYSYFLGFRFMNAMFNWTMTYRLDSDIVVKYGHFIRKNVSKPTVLDIRNKTGMSYWMVSHCYTSSHREDYVDVLARHSPVDIYGNCGKATCPRLKTSKCLENFSNKYFFSFAMENSFCKDYVSEKFYEASQFNAVPVVLGGADYSQLAPRHSYVDASAFENPKDLASFLEKLSKSKGFYRSYFDWKAEYEKGDVNMYCDLCHKLKTVNDSEVKVYQDMRRWWVEESNCKRWTKVA